jgi:hypothetical protein
MRGLGVLEEIELTRRNASQLREILTWCKAGLCETEHFKDLVILALRSFDGAARNWNI